jgi:hypothetical protein
MLKIPEVKFNRSVNESNVETNALGDWLEACTLFDDREISKSDVVDILLENQVCTDENHDLAHLIADQGWHEFARRKRWGGVPDTVAISATRITSTVPWSDDLIRAFFVMLSIQRIFPDWARERQAHVVQGNLFEKVVEAICPALFPGWTTYRAGWSPENTKKIPDIVPELCSRLFMSGAADLDKWVQPSDNDGGLDLVVYRSFMDEREGLPLYFLQCASGKNWREKVSTPNSQAWVKYLNSAVEPSTGIVAPFVIDDFELRRAALYGQAIVIDRIRLVSTVRTGNVALSRELQEELLGWLEPRVLSLPKAA